MPFYGVMGDGLGRSSIAKSRNWGHLKALVTMCCFLEHCLILVKAHLNPKITNQQNHNFHVHVGNVMTSSINPLLNLVEVS